MGWVEKSERRAKMAVVILLFVISVVLFVVVPYFRPQFQRWASRRKERKPVVVTLEAVRGALGMAGANRRKAQPRRPRRGEALLTSSGRAVRRCQGGRLRSAYVVAVRGRYVSLSDRIGGPIFWRTLVSAAA